MFFLHLQYYLIYFYVALFLFIDIKHFTKSVEIGLQNYRFEMNYRYEQSLSVLKHAKNCKEGMITKSSIMLGLGESDDEVKETMNDLRSTGVDILTLGQYLQVS